VSLVDGSGYLLVLQQAQLAVGVPKPGHHAGGGGALGPGARPLSVSLLLVVPCSQHNNKQHKCNTNNQTMTGDG